MFETKILTTVYETERCLPKQDLYDIEAGTPVISTLQKSSHLCPEVYGLVIKAAKNVYQLSTGGWVKHDCVRPHDIHSLTGFEVTVTWQSRQLGFAARSEKTKYVGRQKYEL